MAYETITYDIDGHVATLTLNRPDVKNAFTIDMAREMIAALDAADADDQVRAIIVTGAGSAFCAGADLSEGARAFDLMQSIVAEGDLDLSDVRLRDWGGILNLRIWNNKKPLIAAVNGAAVGIGATMILPMDVRLCADTARFGYVFARRGIVWDGCASWFLPRVVGMGQAMEWGLTGRVFPASEAHAGGLVKAPLAPDALMDAARAIAQEIADNCAPVSVVINRQMAWQMLTEAHPMAAHRLESPAIALAGAGPDAREGVMAFLEKRPADFPGKPSTDMPAYYPWWTEEAY